MSSHGHEPEVARHRGQLAQEVRDVRSVPGALAAEDVGVDQHQRRHATSRYTAAVASATRSQL